LKINAAAVLSRIIMQCSRIYPTSDVRSCYRRLYIDSGFIAASIWVDLQCIVAVDRSSFPAQWLQCHHHTVEVCMEIEKTEILWNSRDSYGSGNW